MLRGINSYNTYIDNAVNTPRTGDHHIREEDFHMKKLYRSVTDSKLTGLCGGLARWLNVDTTLVRLLVAAAAVFSFGTVLVLYVIGSVIVPKESYGGFTDGFDY